MVLTHNRVYNNFKSGIQKISSSGTNVKQQVFRPLCPPPRTTSITTNGSGGTSRGKIQSLPTFLNRMAMNSSNARWSKKNKSLRFQVKTGSVGRRKKALLSGTVGSSAAAKRAWKRRARYCSRPCKSIISPPDFSDKLAEWGGYHWEEISTIDGVFSIQGDDWTGGGGTGPEDDGHYIYPLPANHTFRFYGTTYNSIKISVNGYISFTHTSNNWNTHELPSEEDPDALLAAWWTDLEVPTEAPQGVVYIYMDNNENLVIQYTGMAPYNKPQAPRLTFQIILECNTGNNNGCFKFQYKEVSEVAPDTLAGAAEPCFSCLSIGYENEDGTNGSQLLYSNTENENHNNPWLSHPASESGWLMIPDNGGYASFPFGNIVNN